jgi:CheY-like chemotaxis protein
VEQARLHAEQANLAKSQFLSNMSHELRTPLNAIIGFAQLLNMENLLPTQKQPVDHIHKAALHLLEMVNQILDLSKIEAGMLQIAIEPFSLHNLLDDTCQLLRSSIENKGVTFHCHREQDVPNFVKGDELRIRQIMLNLLANAMKFTHLGSISLSVSATNDPEIVYFEVADTGIGMNEATLQKLFNAFTQADISTSKQYGGTGLGLSLSKELVELMGGKMGVHSVLNEGSKFWFTLRLAKAEVMKHHYTPDASSRLENHKFTMLRVLLVEDNPVNQMVATKMLKKFGIVPAIAKHGQEALDKLAQTTYNLVFLDVQMPVMDGYETIARIRADEKSSHEGKHLYVIGLSANALNEDKAKAMALGMDDYLTKPINFGELQHKLERGLLHIQQIEALEEQIRLERDTDG